MEPFRKFCVQFVSCIVFFMFLHLFLFYVNLGVPNARERYVANWISIKEDYIKQNPGKKIIVLGSSMVLFGVNTKRMEEELGMPAVNLGTHGALWLDYMPRHVESLLSGNIVVLPLDYRLYSDNRYAKEYLIYIWGYDREFFETLPVIEKIKFVYHMDLIFLARQFLARCFHREAYGDDGNYSSRFLNKNGDMTKNSYAQKFTNRSLLRQAPEFVFPSDSVPSRRVMSVLRDFVSYCRENGIKLYVTWPVVCRRQRDFAGRDLIAMRNIKNFWETEGIEMLGDYRDTPYEPDDFYDGLGHLNDRGKEKYTSHLIQILKQPLREAEDL